MTLTLREFILLRIAEDEQQARTTEAAGWDDAAQMQTAYDHHTVLGTLSVIVEAHGPGGNGCQDCGQEWPCRTLHLIASTWREHPDYDSGWVPSAL